LRNTFLFIAGLIILPFVLFGLLCGGNLGLEGIKTLATLDKRVRDAEPTTIPKVLVVTTNINAVEPRIKIKALRNFVSLPEKWYCKCYGGGAGTTLWQIEDSISAPPKKSSLIIPLRFEEKKYCPYVIDRVHVHIGSTVVIYLYRKNEILLSGSIQNKYPELPIVPNRINIPFSNDNGKFMITDSYDFTIPENVTDTIYVHLELTPSKNMAEGHQPEAI
jgi:hypothetical protein